MLPSLLFSMEGSSNNLNNYNNHTPPGFGLAYDEGLILNCVRNRKKNTELPNCPVCSCTIRQGELESHLSLEIDKLIKLSSGSKRKVSLNCTSSSSSSILATPGSSTDIMEDEFDTTGATGSDVYKRVVKNRMHRLRTRSRTRIGSPMPTTGECPVCNAQLPTSRLQRHALRCLKRTGANIDDDISDNSSEEGTIDVENDDPQSQNVEPQAGGSFGAEYQWCGEWRVRATALQEGDSIPATTIRRVSNDANLVVDGDEDTELYGPVQYSPSSITPNVNVDDDDSDDDDNVHVTINSNNRTSEAKVENEGENSFKKGDNGLVTASIETRLEALKARILELESQQESGSAAKCLICLGPYTSPAVSIQCWHVYCEVCWLESLRAKKICPHCNTITTTQHLRRIYM